MSYSKLDDRLATHPDFTKYIKYYVPLAYSVSDKSGHITPIGTWNCWGIDNESERLLREFMYHIVWEHFKDFGAYEFYTSVYFKDL